MFIEDDKLKKITQESFNFEVSLRKFLLTLPPHKVYEEISSSLLDSANYLAKRCEKLSSNENTNDYIDDIEAIIIFIKKCRKQFEIILELLPEKKSNIEKLNNNIVKVENEIDELKKEIDKIIEENNTVRIIPHLGLASFIVLTLSIILYKLTKIDILIYFGVLTFIVLFIRLINLSSWEGKIIKSSLDD